MAITCVICCVGLFIMKNPYALLLGIVIGFVDALPILGTGTIFTMGLSPCVYAQTKTGIHDYDFISYMLLYQTVS